MQSNKFSFPHDGRTNKHGALKAVMTPDNKWVPPAGPGDYNEIDCTHRAQRVRWPSSPAWSVPKGEDQMAVREKQTFRGPSLGPGSYELPSPWDMSRLSDWLPRGASCKSI